MAASAAPAPAKSGKKKVAKALERTESPAPSITSTADKPTDSASSAFESPYIKDLQRTIRNTNKKLANVSRTETLVAQHPKKSLDDLVGSKVIDNDQKAQILKKPALQAQLAQAEEQLNQYLKVDEQYRSQSTAEKAEWEKNLETAKAEAVSEAEAGFKKSLQSNLLVLSQFLRLAAYRREEAQDPESDESQAIEGVLLAIYTGDENAVQAMLKLVDGAEDQIYSVPGEQLQTTYSKVKSLAQEYESPVYNDPSAAVVTENKPEPEVATDPTIAHATVNELESGDVASTNGHSVDAATNGIANASVNDDAANAVGESHWDLNSGMTASQEWVDVKVPRDPAETEAGLAATSAAPANTQSWADDHPTEVATEAPAAPADPNDGFQAVQRNRPRHEREGSQNFRGRGRGEWRGRGRGDGRGRGGRGNRNSGAAGRGGPRRNEES